MPRLFAAALFGLALCASSPALAVECAPHCDYTHDYGPYDFTYVRPGLYGYPACNFWGECLPRLAYTRTVRYGRIFIRPRPVRRPQ